MKLVVILLVIVHYVHKHIFSYFIFMDIDIGIVTIDSGIAEGDGYQR